MNAEQVFRVGGVLALTGLLGGASVASAPAGTHIGFMWPVGLATGAIILATGPWRVVTAVLVAAVGTTTFLIDGTAASLSLFVGVSLAVEGCVIERLLRDRSGLHPMRENDDVIRYAIACGLGGLVGGAGFAAGSAISGVGRPELIVLAATAAHVAGQLIVVPFFLSTPQRTSMSSDRERAIRWVILMGITLVAFVPTDLPSLVFLVLPLLGWTATRSPMLEMLWQLVAVGAIANVATQYGYGPFAAYMTDSDWPAEVLALPQQAFLVGCALVSVPFAVVVRQQRESASQAATERSRADLLVSSAQGLMIVGTDSLGTINLFGPGAQQLLGYSAEEVLGQSPAIFHTEAEIRRKAAALDCETDFTSIVLAQLELPAGTPLEWEYVRKDGQARILSMILSPVRNEHGDVTGYVATADDVTERIEIQQALEKALATERQAVQRLQEIDRTKDTFVSTVSHELRTPITTIIGFLELLLDEMYGELSPEQREALGRMDANSARLLGLIEDLLTMSQVGHADPTSSGSQVDLAAITARVCQLSAAVALGEPQRVRVALPTHPVTLLGDEEQLERLVSNLVSNAVKFSPPEGVVRVDLTDDGTIRRLSVHDDGMGIPEEDLPRIFDRFYRSHNAQMNAVQGSGLGLAIAQSIAEAHRARISVTSTPEQGTTFVVDFPVDHSAQHAAADEAAS